MVWYFWFDRYFHLEKKRSKSPENENFKLLMKSPCSNLIHYVFYLSEIIIQMFIIFYLWNYNLWPDQPVPLVFFIIYYPSINLFLFSSYVLLFICRWGRKEIITAVLPQLIVALYPFILELVDTFGWL